MLHRVRRTGFTLVELLAVAGAVTVLGTQIVGAIEEAQETARRTQCQNNLKQIGLALHNYHDSLNCFPSGWIGGDSEPKRANVFGLNGAGWLLHLSPYLDQARLYHTVEFSASIAGPENSKIVSKSIQGFRCLSDPLQKKRWMLKDAEGNALFEVATANYPGVFGTGDLSRCEKLKPGEDCKGNGTFYLNSNLRIREIEDGLSNTLGVGERTTNMELDRATTWTGVFPKAKSPLSRILGTSNQALHVKEKNVSGFDSAHAGSVQFVNLDGSVRVLNTETDLKLFQALTTRAGGEEIPE